jgi:TetR/AcrR family transcriptional repressor of mexJK operon
MDAGPEAGVSKLTVYSHFNDKETCSPPPWWPSEEQLPPLFFELPPACRWKLCC